MTTSNPNHDRDNINAVPQGYWKNHKDQLIPISQIREIDKLRDELVKKLVEDAQEVQNILREYKMRAFSEIADFIELSAERYDVKLGGKKGNVTLYSFDGKYKIQRAINENMSFDEGILSAKTLIQECVDD